MPLPPRLPINGTSSPRSGMLSHPKTFENKASMPMTPTKKRVKRIRLEAGSPVPTVTSGRLVAFVMRFTRTRPQRGHSAHSYSSHKDSHPAKRDTRDCWQPLKAPGERSTCCLGEVWKCQVVLAMRALKRLLQPMLFGNHMQVHQTLEYHLKPHSVRLQQQHVSRKHHNCAHHGPFHLQ